MKPKYENQLIGCNIKRHRLKAGLRQSELAIYVSQHHRKMTKESLKTLEQNGYRISPTRLYHIAQKLGVSMESLTE